MKDEKRNNNVDNQPKSSTMPVTTATTGNIIKIKKKKSTQVVIEDDREQLKNEVTNLKKVLGELKKENGNNSEIKKLKEKIKNLEDTNKEITNAKNNIVLQYTQLLDEMAILKKEKGEIGKQTNGKENPQKNKNEIKTNEKPSNVELENELKIANEEISRLKKLEKDLNLFHENNKKLISENEGVKLKLQTLESKLKTSASEQTSSIMKIKELKTQLLDLQKKNETNEKENTDLKKQVEKVPTDQKISKEEYNRLQTQYFALDKINSELKEKTEKQKIEIGELKTNAYLPLEKMIAKPNPCGTIVYAFNEKTLSSENELKENGLNINAMYMLNVINGSRHFDAKNIFVTSFNLDNQNSVEHRIAIHNAIKLNTVIPCEYDKNTASCIDDDFRSRVEKLCQPGVQNNKNEKDILATKIPFKQKKDIELGKISLLEITYAAAKQREKNKIQGNIQVMFFNADELVASGLIMFFNTHRKTLLAKGVDICFWKGGKFSAVVQGEGDLIKSLYGIKDCLIDPKTVIMPTEENSVIDWDKFIKGNINNERKSFNEKTNPPSKNTSQPLSDKKKADTFANAMKNISEFPGKTFKKISDISGDVKNIFGKGLSMFRSIDDNDRTLIDNNQPCINENKDEENNVVNITKAQPDIEASKLELIIKKEDKNLLEKTVSEITEGFKELSKKEHLTYNPKF